MDVFCTSSTRSFCLSLSMPVARRSAFTPCCKLGGRWSERGSVLLRTPLPKKHDWGLRQRGVGKLEGQRGDVRAHHRWLVLATKRDKRPATLSSDWTFHSAPRPARYLHTGKSHTSGEVHNKLHARSSAAGRVPKLQPHYSTNPTYHGSLTIITLQSLSIESKGPGAILKTIFKKQPYHGTSRA